VERIGKQMFGLPEEHCIVDRERLAEKRQEDSRGEHERRGGASQGSARHWDILASQQASVGRFLAFSG
jgi:hypothetical protein